MNADRALRDDPAWAEMFARLDAKDKAARDAEAERWRLLCVEEKWAEIEATVGRWRRRAASPLVEIDTEGNP
jgi:hypothetical protein